MPNRGGLRCHDFQLEQCYQLMVSALLTSIPHLSDSNSILLDELDRFDVRRALVRPICTVGSEDSISQQSNTHLSLCDMRDDTQLRPKHIAPRSLRTWVFLLWPKLRNMALITLSAFEVIRLRSYQW